jgi:hypothetical protein
MCLPLRSRGSTPLVLRSNPYEGVGHLLAVCSAMPNTYGVFDSRGSLESSKLRFAHCSVVKEPASSAKPKRLEFALANSLALFESPPLQKERLALRFRSCALRAPV